MSIEAMKQALEACELLYIPEFTQDDSPINNCITALRTAIEEAEKQEPVAWYRDEDGIRIYYESKCWDDATPLYTTPPKREWVGLTDEEVIECFDSVALGVVETENVVNKHLNVYNAAKAIEAKLKEKNT